MSLERRYQLVTGGRSFPKMPSALKEVTGRMGGPSPELPPPLGMSLVRSKLFSAALPLLLNAFWLELGAPGCSEPNCGLQKPSRGWEGGECSRAGRCQERGGTGGSPRVTACCLPAPAAASLLPVPALPT